MSRHGVATDGSAMKGQKVSAMPKVRRALICTLYFPLKIGIQEDTRDLNTDMSCHHRQFNETLFLPLCSSKDSSNGKEYIYQIVVRGVMRASNKRLVGFWSEPQITSFQCNQGSMIDYLSILF